jgi:hypothetical protein
MRHIRISLPDGLYRELQEVSAAAKEPGFGPAHWAGELVASELAARRLPSVSLGSHGPRITAAAEPECHRVLLPEKG